jgi:hypothetical protein
MGQNSRLVVGQPCTPMLSKGFNGHDGKNQLSQCELAMKKNKYARVGALVLYLLLCFHCVLFWQSLFGFISAHLFSPLLVKFRLRALSLPVN